MESQSEIIQEAIQILEGVLGDWAGVSILHQPSEDYAEIKRAIEVLEGYPCPTTKREVAKI